MPQISVDAATTRAITLGAVIVKMPSKEAISTLTPEVFNCIEQAASRVRAIIQTETNADTAIIPAGVGNTIGVE